MLSVRKPEVTLDAANNADYKQLIFQMLPNHFPDWEVFIPLPSYYNIEENNYEMDLAPIHGNAYAPMASTHIQHMQLCHPHQVRVLSAMKPVNGCTNVLELRKCLQEACKRRPDRPIYLFREFTCTLSYTCLINGSSRGMQSRGTFFGKKEHRTCQVAFCLLLLTKRLSADV